MKTASKKTGAGFWAFFGLLALVDFALLELNRNPVHAWLLSAAILLLYALTRVKTLRAAPFLRRLALFLIFGVLLATVLLFFVGKTQLHPAVEGRNGGETAPLRFENGAEIVGLRTADGAVEVYAGIPYAAAERWREPTLLAPRTQAAVAFAPMEMQPRHAAIFDSLSQIIGYHDYRISLRDNFVEPCAESAELTLNVWRPAGAQEALPVLVYIHGGSLQTGQPWYADYRGEGLARKGVIVVNMAYRLGVFGFLALDELAAESPNGTTGNYGLLDQIAALQWVRENIDAFGGDPENVTLAGESAGSACVSALCTSPLARGLFRRAIGESSTVTAPAPAHSFRALDEALETGRETLARFGAANAAELRAVPAEKLAAAADTNHHITIDGYVLTETPYESYRRGVHNEEALLHGFNSQESAPFILFSQANLKNYEAKVRAYFGGQADEVLALYPADSDALARSNWADIYGAAVFNYGHHCWTRQAIANGVPVWEYEFCKTNGRLGPWHSGEEIYCYGNLPADSRLFDESDRALAEVFSSYFANFCRTGDPNGPGLPAWARSETGAEIMELDVKQGMTLDPYRALYAVLDRKYGWEE